MSAFYSTILYLFIFIITILFLYLFISYFPQKNTISNSLAGTWCCFWGCIIALIIPSWLAGVRADTVGADTVGYGIMAFKYALIRSRDAFLSGQSEIVFYGLAYFVSRVTENVAFWLGIVEFLTIAPIFYVAYKERKKLNVCFAMIVYLFKFYNYSLCIMRQSLACSFLMLAFYFWKNKKYVRTMIVILLALGIHSTAFIGLLFYVGIVGIFHVCKFERRKRKGKIYFLIVSIIATMALFLPKIIEIILTSNILPERYANFEQLLSDGNITSYSLFESMVRVILLVLCVIVLNKVANLNIFEKYMLMMTIAACVIYISGALIWGVGTIYRITEYIDFSFIFTIPILTKYYKDKKSSYSCMALALFFVILYWLIVYIVYPGGLGFETQNYSFR